MRGSNECRTKSDVPARHYYQQCQHLFLYSQCTNQFPHWGNNCSVLVANLKAKRAFHASARQNDKVMEAWEKQKLRDKLEYKDGYFTPGYKDRFDEGMSHLPTAILDSGANSTYVIHRHLLENSTIPTSPSVSAADGSSHPILAPGTLVGHPISLRIMYPVLPQT